MYYLSLKVIILLFSLIFLNFYWNIVDCQCQVKFQVSSKVIQLYIYIYTYSF